ncbi:MAG: DUF502 domain-containing protein [Xanthobacteraceae bacterium]|nr:MAG: DUF502 domain-containing protein [Xanthobacteraceae bacterium]
MARIRNYFLTGLIVTGPAAITVWLIWSFVTWVDGLVRPLIPAAYRPENFLPAGVPGSGLIIAFVGLTLVGFLAANLVGRTLVEVSESILNRMPIVRAIYRSLKQVFETLFADSGSSFRKVGLVEYPAPGMWSIVLYSQPPGEEIKARLPGSDEYLSVFLPCAPNPTTGFFFYVARKSVIDLDINPEEAATLVMSAGMIQPGASNQKKLAAMAEAAKAARDPS